LEKRFFPDRRNRKGALGPRKTEPGTLAAGYDKDSNPVFPKQCLPFPISFFLKSPLGRRFGYGDNRGRLNIAGKMYGSFCSGKFPVKFKDQRQVQPLQVFPEKVLFVRTEPLIVLNNVVLIMLSQKIKDFFFGHVLPITAVT